MANPEGFNQYKHGPGSTEEARASHKAQQDAHKEHNRADDERKTIDPRDPKPKKGMTHRVEAKFDGKWGYHQDARSEHGAHKEAAALRSAGFQTRVLEIKKPHSELPRGLRKAVGLNTRTLPGGRTEILPKKVEPPTYRSRN